MGSADVAVAIARGADTGHTARPRGTTSRRRRDGDGGGSRDATRSGGSALTHVERSAGHEVVNSSIDGQWRAWCSRRFAASCL